jgi:hypothetical protein
MTEVDRWYEGREKELEDKVGALRAERDAMERRALAAECVAADLYSERVAESRGRTEGRSAVLAAMRDYLGRFPKSTYRDGMIESLSLFRLPGAPAPGELLAGLHEARSALLPFAELASHAAAHDITRGTVGVSLGDCKHALDVLRRAGVLPPAPSCRVCGTPAPPGVKAPPIGWNAGEGWTTHKPCCGHSDWLECPACQAIPMPTPGSPEWDAHYARRNCPVCGDGCEYT